MDIKDFIIINALEFAYNNFKEFEGKTNFKVSYEDLKNILKIQLLKEDLNKLNNNLKREV